MSGRLCRHLPIIQDRLYILVTDQGYLHESQVVWEALTSIQGDTTYVDCRFAPFVPHEAAVPTVANAPSAVTQASPATVVAPAAIGTQATAEPAQTKMTQEEME